MRAVELEPRSQLRQRRHASRAPTAALAWDAGFTRMRVSECARACWCMHRIERWENQTCLEAKKARNAARRPRVWERPTWRGRTLGISRGSLDAASAGGSGVRASSSSSSSSKKSSQTSGAPHLRTSRFRMLQRAMHHVPLRTLGAAALRRHAALHRRRGPPSRAFRQKMCVCCVCVCVYTHRVCVCTHTVCVCACGCTQCVRA